MDRIIVFSSREFSFSPSRWVDLFRLCFASLLRLMGVLFNQIARNRAGLNDVVYGQAQADKAIS